MYSIIFIFFVNLCLIILRAESADALTIQTNRSAAGSNSAGEIFKINKYDSLNIIVNNLNETITENCGGSCTVNEETVNISCKVNEDQYGQALNVTVKQNITKDLSGKWHCNYKITIKQRQDSQGGSRSISNHFQLNVKSVNTIPESSFWEGIDKSWPYYLGIPVGLIVFLIIIVQTYCIIRYKRKAKAIRREAQWSSVKTENVEDAIKTIRYSKMPGLRKKEVLIPESRESGIYEVLENIRVAPEPPPVESLPRKSKTKDVPKLLPVPSDSSAPSPFWNSLLRRKNKKLEETGSDSANSTLDKRTTLDRIKERPPLELPNDGEIYEAVEETPQPTRKEMKVNVPKVKAAPKEEFRAFHQLKPKPAVPLPSNIANVAPPLNTQLKQAVEKRNRLNQVQPQPPPAKPITNTLLKPQTKEPIPNATPNLLKQKQWQTESPLPKPKWANQPSQEPSTPKEWLKEPIATNPWQKGPTTTKHWQKEPTTTKPWQKEPTAPKPWQKEANTTKPKDWPRETTDTQYKDEPPKPMGSLRPKVTPYNPGLPPPDAPPAKIRTSWGETVAPKPRPPPPVKPKQLHPLPHPPCEPEPIHPEPDDHDSDDSESEWMYEPLPQYNIYSM